MNTKEIQQVMENKTQNTTMMSLYEYLGRAAGADLGKLVYEAAYTTGVETTTQEVSNSKYQGSVRKYPKHFLDYYFGNSVKQEQPLRQVDLDDDLPF